MKVEIEGYTKTEQADGTIVFTPIDTKPKFWVPEVGESYSTILGYGDLASFLNRGDKTDQSCSNHYNIFKTRADAEDVARYQRVFNAVCRAVKQIDPDFVPDWNDIGQSKFVPTWGSLQWRIECWQATRTIFPPVSTEEKCQQVIDLLNAEGIVPVGGGE